MKKVDYNIPFDQFSRQIQVRDAIDSLRGNSEEYAILDVGGYKGCTTKMQPKDKVTILDVFDVKAKNYVKGDGKSMPFKDKEFDFVLNFDVLEHIKKAQRPTFIKEASRVASKGIIAAFPTNSPEGDFAEKNLNRLYKRLHKEDHRWLKEHIDYETPDYKEVERIYKKLGFYTTSLKSNDLETWLLMQGTMFVTSKHMKIGTNTAALNKAYNREIGAYDVFNNNSPYRRIVIGLRNKVDYEKLIRWQKNIPATPTGKKLTVLNMINNFYANSAASMEAENKKLKDQLIREKQITMDLSKAINEIKSTKAYKVNRKLQIAKHKLKETAGRANEK